MWNLELSKNGVEGLIWDVAYKVEELQSSNLTTMRLAEKKNPNLIELFYQYTTEYNGSFLRKLGNMTLCMYFSPSAWEQHPVSTERSNTADSPW